MTTKETMLTDAPIGIMVFLRSDIIEARSRFPLINTKPNAGATIKRRDGVSMYKAIRPPQVIMLNINVAIISRIPMKIESRNLLLLSCSFFSKSIRFSSAF